MQQTMVKVFLIKYYGVSVIFCYENRHTLLNMANHDTIKSSLMRLLSNFRECFIVCVLILQKNKSHNTLIINL